MQHRSRNSDLELRGPRTTPQHRHPKRPGVRSARSSAPTPRLPAQRASERAGGSCSFGRGRESEGQG
eukprot:7521604-Alexandrium_andersonii.AAC.1